MTPTLIYNAIRTPDGTVLESLGRHDYKTHLDENGKTYMLDGGVDYIRTSCHADQVSMALYSDSPHETQRSTLTWGTYGLDGTDDYKRITIAEMTTGHIKAVLEECVPQEALRSCMVQELEDRITD